MKKILLLTALTIVLLNSCTIQKRRYMPGYYVEWAIHLRGQAEEAPVKERAKKKEPIIAMESKHYRNELQVQISDSFFNKPLKTFWFPENKRVFVNRKQVEKNLITSTKKPETHLTTKIFKTKSPHYIKKQKKEHSGDGLIYLTSSLMALASLGAIRANRKRVIKITRWAKANPKKTRWLITGIQLPLIGLGAAAGYNLNKMGYQLSDTMTYVFGAIMVLGFLSVPFLPKKNSIVLPKHVNRHRLAYLGVTLSSLMMMTGFGNRVADKYPNSPITHFAERIDQRIFSDNSAKHVNSVTPEANHSRIQKSREIAEAGLCVLAVLLILGLIVTMCAGICLFLGGASGVFVGGEAVAAILGGLVIAGLSVYGMVKIFKSNMCK